MATTLEDVVFRLLVVLESSNEDDVAQRLAWKPGTFLAARCREHLACGDSPHAPDSDRWLQEVIAALRGRHERVHAIWMNVGAEEGKEAFG